MNQRISLFLIVLSVLFTSCSREWKIAHAKKKIAKMAVEFPELLKPDTLKIHDTLIVNPKESKPADVPLDSLKKHPNDTIKQPVIFDNGKPGIAKFFTDKKTGKPGFSVSLPGDTIEKTILKPVQQIEIKPGHDPTFMEKAKTFINHFAISFMITMFLAAILFLSWKFR